MFPRDVHLPKTRSKRVLRLRSLNTESAYREVSRSGPVVELEVLSAPGLKPGTRLRVTSAAVRGMRPDVRSAGEEFARVSAEAVRFVIGHRPKLRLPAA